MAALGSDVDSEAHVSRKEGVMRRWPWVLLGAMLLILSGCTFFQTAPTVLYHETFSGETVTQWSQTENDSTKKWIEAGRYHFRFKTAEGRWTATQNTQQGPFDNFRLDVELTHISGQNNLCASGVLFRIADWDNYYGFRISPSGTYSLWKQFAGEFVQLVGWTSSDAIVKGAASNTVSVIADGSTLTFFVNGQQVHAAVDASLTSGRVGVYCRTYDGATDASMAFESLLVTALE
jgi:hypothetical protein